MPVKTWFFFLAVGRLITWLLQINGLLKPLWASRPVLTELSECDLCLGFWVYLALALAYPKRIFGLWPHLIEAGLLAAISAFIGHLAGIGWRDKFTMVILE